MGPGNREFGIRILDRYTVKEFLGPFFFCIAGFTVILVSGLLFDLTDLIFVKKVSFETVIRMLIYKLPAIVVIALPVATLFGSLLSMGRLARDSEMTVIRGSGVSLARIALPVLAASLLVSGVIYLMNERIVPWANHEYENILRTIIFKDSLPNVEQDVFFKGIDNKFFYVRKVDTSDHSLTDVMIYEVRSDGFPRIITAKRGRYEGEIWKLWDGVQRELDRDGFVTNEVSFEQMELVLGEQTEAFFGEQKTTDEMNRKELKQHIELFSKSGLNVRSFVVDYHLKLALPFSSFVFALLGVSLGPRSGKGGRFFGASASLGIAFLYYVITSVSRSLGSNGLLSPIAAAWLTTVLLFVAGICLLVRADKV